MIGDKKDKGRSVTTQTLRIRFHKSLKRAGLGDKSQGWYKLHINTLRKYFRTQSEIAGMPRPLIETLMGHKGRYLDDSYWRSNEAENREEYRKAVPYLTISKAKEVSMEELRKKQALDTVKMLGFDEEKIKRVEGVLAKYESVDEAMEEIRKLSLGSGSHEREEETTNGGQPTYEARIITEDALVDFMEAGWDIVKELSNGKIVVRRSIG